MATVVFAIVVSFLIGDRLGTSLNSPAEPTRQAPPGAGGQGVRQELFDALKPVALAQCTLERFGEPHDGGYLLCGNLLQGARAGYSYGINGYDKWGCDVAARIHAPVHQYDCFNLTVPVCPNQRTVFHAECVGPEAKEEDGRPFDSIRGQISRNGDAGRHVVMKIDVEGAEWTSLMATPDDLLQRIDQLAIEFHGVPQELHLQVVRRLKRFFHVAHLHFNNFACVRGVEPFPAWAYEVLLVNKQLDAVDPSREAGGLLPIDAPNEPGRPDCQIVERR